MIEFEHWACSVTRRRGSGARTIFRPAPNSRGFKVNDSGKCRWDRQDPQLTKRNPKRAVNRYAMQAALGMMRKVHKASRIASYMGSMATVTQGAVTMVAIATTMLPGVETFGCPQTMAYQESINVSNSFIEGRGVPEPRTVSDDKLYHFNPTTYGILGFRSRLPRSFTTQMTTPIALDRAPDQSSSLRP